jgi:hypothetical protein
LPDGIFLDQKSQFELIVEGLDMEDVGIFYGHSVHLVHLVNVMYFMPIWYIFPCLSMHIFTHFGKLYQAQSGNPDIDRAEDSALFAYYSLYAKLRRNRCPQW